MAFGVGLLSWIPSLAWVMFYVITALVALYYLLTARADKLVAWAFGLYIASAAVLAVTEFGLLDAVFGKGVQLILVFGAIMLFGKHVTA